MPIVGNRKSTATMGNGYRNDPISSFAQSFKECASDILNEAGVDLFMEPQKALQIGAANSILKNFYVEASVDPAEVEAVDPEHSAEAIEDAEAMAEAQFENDRDAVLEHTNMANMNPVIGMTFPIHKNILMNNVFDKGAIPKFVAREPKFTISMESRILVTPDGKEIDMYKEQYKIREAIDSTAPFKETEIDMLPLLESDETEQAKILASVNGTETDNLSIDTYISAVKVNGINLLKDEDIDPSTGKLATKDVTNGSYWIPVNLRFTPSYGEIDRVIAEEVSFVTRDATDTSKKIELKGVVTGYMRNNKFMITASGVLSDAITPVISGVKINARLDTSSAAVQTCSTKWRVRTDIVEIGSANPINTTISPEEVKDVGALYNVNQLSKVLSLMKTALGDYKDSKIKNELDKSFQTMPETNKFATTFDFAPRAGYALDHVEWRYKTFMDYLDGVTTGLLQVLNDPNMTISIFGSPELIRKITPTEYTYQTPSNIGPVELDYVKTVVTSDKRVYQFIASDKLRGNPNLIIVLCPRNTDRIVYRIYDYQMYISNEIRNIANPALPAIHAFERWKFVEYQPVQGRIKIMNPTGLYSKDIAPNDDPIGGQYMSDFNLLK